MEGGGLWVSMSLAMVHGVVWGFHCCATGGQILKSTTPTLAKLPPPPVLVGLPLAPPPPHPARVVILCALKDGIEALNNIRSHGTQPNPQAACLRHGLGDNLLRIEEVV